MAQQQKSATEGTAEDKSFLPLVEEAVNVSKIRVPTGKLRVRMTVETVGDVAQADLERQDVEVTRVACDRIVTTRPEVRTEGEVTIVPILEEVLFVEKRLVLKEELYIRRRTTTETIHQNMALRRQRAVVERLDEAGHKLEKRTDHEHD